MFHVRNLLVVLVAVMPMTAAEAVDQNVLNAVARSYLAKEPAQGIPTGLSYETALDLQKQYIRLLIPKLGPGAGYKVGLVTPADTLVVSADFLFEHAA